MNVLIVGGAGYIGGTTARLFEAAKHKVAILDDLSTGHRHNIEGLEQFEAEPGDVVYVPRQTWHLASNGGQQGERSCRLAMNGFPYQAHMYEAN